MNLIDIKDAVRGVDCIINPNAVAKMDNEKHSISLLSGEVIELGLENYKKATSAIKSAK